MRYYGQVCFVIKPEKILLTKEFFVFPFNTGRAFSTSSDQDKTCDVRTLIEALEQQHPSFEILVRRRIRINPENTAKIICPAGYKERIEQIALQKGLEISTETLDEGHILKEGCSLELVDPLDTQKNLITLGANEYLQEKEYIYVKTEYSNCILTLKISESNKLIDVATGNEVGRLIKSAYEENILGPYKGPQL